MTKMNLSQTELMNCALQCGFSISTAYGQDANKLMPISDHKTLAAFAEAVIRANNTGAKE